ncbi:Gx transporter family protein [bacterium]
MTKHMTKLALFIALATIMASVESMIQTPVPFLRLGLANGITLLVLKWYGFREGLFVTIIRVVLAGLIVGRIFQPTFFLSLSGGLIATLIMSAALKWEGRWFSLIGISILGAFFHNFTQLIVASFLIHQFIGLSILPIFFITSLIAGLLIGYFTLLVDRAMKKHPEWVG